MNAGTSTELRRERRKAELIVKLASLVFFVAAAIYTLLLFYPIPVHDHWDLIDFHQESTNGTLTLHDIFALHGSHWHASGYIIMLGAAYITGMNHLAEAIANLVLAFFGFWGLARILLLQPVAHVKSKSALLVLPIVAFFYFSLDQSENWLWGWQTAVFASTCGAIWCIERLSQPHFSILNTLIACGAGAISIYGFATGWALIPIGFGLILINGALRSWKGAACLAIWTGLACLLIWHFTLAYSATNANYIGSTSPSGTPLEVALKLATYAIKYAASPVTRFSSEIAIPIFFISCGFLVWALLLLYRNRKASLKQFAPLLALCAYSLGAGLLTGLGRLENFGADTAFLGRYITFGNMFWIGLLSTLLYAIPEVSKIPKRSFIGFVGLVCLLKIATIGNVLQKTIPRANNIRLAAEEIRNCYPIIPDETLIHVAAPTQNVDARMKYLSENKLSVFRFQGNCPD